MVAAGTFDITGKIALVTGSSRGIGFALARGLLEAGCSIVVNSRSAATADRAREELATETTRAVVSVPFDCTNADAVRGGVAAIESQLGPIDILVNNVGTQKRATFVEFDDEAWQQIMATNLTSAFLVSREVARTMIERRRGKIINICSVQSELARPGVAPYAASKGGLKMLTQGMCADLAPYGIQVNGLGPGYFATELTAPLVVDDRFSAWVASRTPTGRWGNVEELIGTLIYLASPASDFVNGQVIYVDGGMLVVL